MRQEFIELAKAYLKKKDHPNATYESMEKFVLTLGVTSEEFQEAVRQIQKEHHGHQPQSKESLLTSFKNASLLKKLIEVDIVAHILLVLVVVVFGGYYAITVLFNNNYTPLESPEKHFLAATQKKQPEDISSIKAYANAVPVNPSNILVFPSRPIKLSVRSAPKKEIVGFFPYWMSEKQEQIDLSTLTTMILFGLTVDRDGNILVQDQENSDKSHVPMWTDPNIDKLLLRAQNRRLPVELTLKTFTNTTIENLTRSEEAQKKFISNALYMLSAKNLSGINLDFEYSGTPDKGVTEGFTRLITNLRAAMKQQLPTGTLSVDTHIYSATLPGIFDLEMLSPQVDRFIIMGYDVHTPQGSAGPIAPLDGPMSIASFMQAFLDKVVPSKLILAVPYYAYDWLTEKDGQGSILPISQALQTSAIKQVTWDEKAQSPSYIYTDVKTREKHIVYFENVRSLGAKYDYINQKDLKGAGIWALGYDGGNPDLEQVLVDKFFN